MMPVFQFESFGRRPVIPRNAIFAAICTGLLALSGSAMADEYRAGEYFGLDLSKAVLSPKRLGPPTEFAPVPVEAKSDRSGATAQAPTEPKTDRQIVVRTTREKAARAEQPRPPARAEQPRAPARAKVVKRRGNPLDAQARDTRIQVWPCTSGGICNWR
jgi:hypothetical protein